MNEDEAKEGCQNCRYSVEGPRPNGADGLPDMSQEKPLECRRFPPQFSSCAPGPGQVAQFYLFPIVGPGIRCGEYAAK